MPIRIREINASSSLFPVHGPRDLHASLFQRLLPFGHILPVLDREAEVLLQLLLQLLLWLGLRTQHVDDAL